MSKILWHGNSKELAEATLDRKYLPADNKAKIIDNKDGTWSIEAESFIEYVPQKVTKKSLLEAKK